jgi:excisionase family DNA binding protein
MGRGAAIDREMKPMQGSVYLTVTEVAGYLKIPEETIYKYARSGRIPASKLGRHWRFTRMQIDNWVTRRTAGGQDRMRVLVVDDDESVRSILTRWLHEGGCEATAVSGGQEAIHALEGAVFDLVLLDLMMPTMNGVEALREIKRMAPETMVVIVTAFYDGQLMDQAMELGPIMALKKPVAKDALLTMVNYLSASGRGYSVGKG